MEKEREREREEEKESKKVKVGVIFHGADGGEIEVEAGSSLSDVLAKIEETHPVNLREMTVMLNGQIIAASDGKLVEDPVIVEDSVLSLLLRFVGGNGDRAVVSDEDSFLI